MARTDIIHGDRRSEKRYPYELELRFTYTLNNVEQFGSGHTLDLSRAAVRFAAENPPPDGADVELRISWPFLLQNVCPLELIVRGTTMSTSARGTILMMNDYEFRTCGERSFDGLVAHTISDSGFVA